MPSEPATSKQVFAATIILIAFMFFYWGLTMGAIYIVDSQIEQKLAPCRQEEQK